jgi:N-acetylneuraminic acid mutarotase
MRIRIFTIAIAALAAVASPASAATNLTWTSDSPLQIARGGLAAAYANGNVFVVGGFTSGFAQALNTAEMYEPEGNTSKLITPMPTARGDLAAASVNGIVYAIGGYDSSDNVVSAVESFNSADPAAGWQTDAPLPPTGGAASRAGAGGIAAASYNGLIYAVGGYDQTGKALANLEIYNPQANSWTSGPPMPTARGHLRVDFSGGLLYAIGGFDAKGTPQSAVEAYDPIAGRWYTKAPIPIARGGQALATLSDGRILAAGGSTGHGALSDVELYTPSSNSWQQLTSLPQARGSMAGAAYGDDDFLAMGGFQPTPSGPLAQSIVESTQL